MAKQYGLTLPNKDRSHKIGQVSLAKPSIFNDDSDSDTPKTSVTGVSAANNLKKQVKLTQDKAAQEDPSVYQYDEVYDEMEQKRKESKLARKDLDRKPKYISKLLAAAEKRKKENERRIERQVHKEREEEGDMYKDKESFITSAYKRKLEEMKELEEQEQREEYLESIGDVRKQGNLDGFYRHLYDQKLNYEEKEEDETKTEVKEEPKSEEPKEHTKLEDRISDSQSDDEDRVKWKRDARKRKYRKHEDSDDEEPEIKKEHLPSNLDADSDFSIDSSDSEDEHRKKEKAKEDKEKKTDEVVVEANIESDGKTEDKHDVEKEEKHDVEKEETLKTEKEVKVKKPKVDIWKKRTVGEKFDEAVKRYFERKALREMGQ